MEHHRNRHACSILRCNRWGSDLTRVFASIWTNVQPSCPGSRCTRHWFAIPKLQKRVLCPRPVGPRQKVASRRNYLDSRVMIPISDELVGGHPCPSPSLCRPSQRPSSPEHPLAHTAWWWPKASSGQSHGQVRWVGATGEQDATEATRALRVNSEEGLKTEIPATAHFETATRSRRNMRFNTELLRNSRSTLLDASSGWLPSSKFSGALWPTVKLPMLSIVGPQNLPHRPEPPDGVIVVVTPCNYCKECTSYYRKLATKTVYIQQEELQEH